MRPVAGVLLLGEVLLRVVLRMVLLLEALLEVALRQRVLFLLLRLEVLR
jgi:hypothetical protein